MKKLLLIALMFVGISASAQWNYESEVSPFEGKRDIVFGRGHGGEFPYQNPTIIIRRQKGALQIYVTGAGYVGSYRTYYLQVANKGDVESFLLSPSMDNDAGFLRQDSLVEFIRLLISLESEDSVHFRLASSGGVNTFSVSTSGLIDSINKMNIDLRLPEEVEVEVEDPDDDFTPLAFDGNLRKFAKNNRGIVIYLPRLFKKFRAKKGVKVGSDIYFKSKDGLYVYHDGKIIKL